jgi:hypothetical protein
MKKHLAVGLLITCVIAHAELTFKLPPTAKYDVSAETIAKAKLKLTTNLVSEAATLTNLFVTPTICGPGLWNILKDSPRFSTPPAAKGTARIPTGDGKFQELPMATLLHAEELASFRMALADLLSSQGALTVREPNAEEFMAYWAVIPFDEITGPLLVAEGKDATLFCQFNKGNVFWIDEVKRMHIRKHATP